MEGNSAANSLASSKIDNLTRADLNRTMSEWSVRLQTLLETERSKQKAGDLDGHSKMKVCLFFVSVVHFTLYLADLSSMMLIQAAG